MCWVLYFQIDQDALQRFAKQNAQSLPVSTATSKILTVQGTTIACAPTNANSIQHPLPPKSWD